MLSEAKDLWILRFINRSRLDRDGKSGLANSSAALQLRFDQNDITTRFRHVTA